MKNILAENMLRFGAKNLTDATKQKLEQLAEQNVEAGAPTPKVIPVTNKVVYTSGPSMGDVINKPTMHLNTTDPKAPVLYIAGTSVSDSKSIAVARNGMIYDGRTYPYASYNMADFILKATEELFGTWKSESNVVETLTALRDVQKNLGNDPGGSTIGSMIQKILGNAVAYGKMEQPAYSSAIQKFGGNLVQNNPYAFYNPIRQYLGLPIENTEFMKNPAKRGSVPSPETPKPAPTDDGNTI